jgi:hypothetical protein
MPFISPSELSTHLYGEITAEIHRGNTSIVQAAIDAAISEASSYLNAFDVAAVFAATGTNRHAYLLLCVKDIAVWHYIQLANPAVEMQLRLERYEKAIEWLTKVQKGQAVPNLPYPEPPVDTNGDGDADGYIKWGSNTKRINNF